MLLFLLVVFIGMGTTVLPVVQGDPGPDTRLTEHRDGPLTIWPPFLLLIASLVMGVFMPAPIRDLVREAADYVGGVP
jgi:hydrogenase-4 component F